MGIVLRISLAFSLHFLLHSPVLSQTLNAAHFPMEYAQAKQRAETSGKRILVVFAGNKCENNIQTKKWIEADPEVKSVVLSGFELALLDLEDFRPLPKEAFFISPSMNRIVTTKGQQNIVFLKEVFKENKSPFVVVLDAREEELARSGFLSNPESLTAFLSPWILRKE